MIEVIDDWRICRELAATQPECQADPPSRSIRFVLRQGECRAMRDTNAAHHALERMMSNTFRQRGERFGRGWEIHLTIKAWPLERGKSLMHERIDQMGVATIVY